MADTATEEELAVDFLDGEVLSAIEALETSGVHLVIVEAGYDSTDIEVFADPVAAYRCAAEKAHCELVEYLEDSDGPIALAPADDPEEGDVVVLVDLAAERPLVEWSYRNGDYEDYVSVCVAFNIQPRKG